MKIESIEQLRELYGYPNERAAKKELPELEKHSINFIEKSPFMLISTCNKAGMLDVSPKGGQPGFVKILNNKQLVIMDSKGNNRIDSLINIIETGQIGSLFLIPGVDETLRVNGKAHITTDPEILNLFTSEKNPPKTCIIIEVQEVFLHCAKALMRSKLWSPESKIERKELPTIGQMLKDQIGFKEAPEPQEDMVKRYMGDL